MGPVWYVSGEETASQIAGRAKRLGIESSELWLLRETHIDTLCDQVVASYQPHAEHSPKPPSLIVIDSIQTMVCDAGGASAAGGVTQVRECVALLLRLAKSTNIAVVIIGHVTKSGDVAGPKTVEHMVDVVLYLEGGDKVGDVNLRLLRAAKNRFGSGDAVGVYEMTSSGSLLPVTDPSSLLISGRMKDVEGCATSLVLEGLRCLTVEIQALVTPSLEQSGRRTVQGMAFSRLSLLLGVLRKRCSMYFGKQDTYINVVGNLRLDDDRTSDLAAAVALVSSLLTIPVRSDTAFCGEVGLLGELRHVSLLEKRLAEARRMGFSRVVAPGNGMVGTGAECAISRLQGVDWIQCNTLVEALNEGLVQRLPKRQRSRRQPGIRQASSPESLDELLLGEIIVDDEDLGFE
jgi:DNA repair protein RadA/Sms